MGANTNIGLFGFFITIISLLFTIDLSLICFEMQILDRIYIFIGVMNLTTL